jgi:5-methylcytosine-specific restriction endonuclease McrBC regulatory subunit McrC
MTDPELVRIPERGHVDVDASTWRRLTSDEAFWRLVDRGIIGVSYRSRERMRIHGSCYVGRAFCAGLTVEVHEKINGALAALLQSATHGAFRIERAFAPSSELGELVALLVHQFLNAVSSYANAGRGRLYASTSHVGSLVGGKLNATRTIRLHTRGLRHLVHYEKQVLTCNTPVNSILLATLREIERLAALIDISTAELARSRGLAMLFSDCRNATILFGSRESLVRLANDLGKSRHPELVRDLLALAGVLLAHESFEHSAERVGTAPRAWFLNLESLFETAVRNALQNICGAQFSVRKGSLVARRVFEEASGEFRAHPDLVLTPIEGSTVAAGDVKYKTWSATARAPDLYQLLVHASAFESPVCFLIFPGDTFDFRYLGRSTTGVLTWLFAVDVRNLTEDLRQVLLEIGNRPGKGLTFTGYADSHETLS